MGLTGFTAGDTQAQVGAHAGVLDDAVLGDGKSVCNGGLGG